LPTPLVVKNGSNARNDVRVHPNAAVGHGDEDVLAGLYRIFMSNVLIDAGVGRLDSEMAPVRGVPRVDTEIENGVFELAGIGLGLPKAGAQHRLHGNLFAEGSRQQIGHPRDHFVRINRFRRQRLLARKGQQTLCQTCRAPRSIDCAIDETMDVRLSLLELALHEIKTANNHASMLLKSCAKPPVSWPIASIF
jgi:hypothetical protein